MVAVIPDATFVGVPNFIPPNNARASETDPVTFGAIHGIILNQAIGGEDIHAMIKISRSIVIQGVIFDDQVGMINTRCFSLFGQDAIVAGVVDGTAINSDIVSATSRA